MEISDFFLIFWLGHSERLDLTWVISFLFWFCDGMADSAALGSGRWADVREALDACHDVADILGNVVLEISKYFRYLLVGRDSNLHG